MKPYDSFLLVGRFQSLQIGHCSLFDTGLLMADRGLVLVGSSQEVGTERNPFDVVTRVNCIKEIYGDRIEVKPLPDMTHEEDITPDWGRFVMRHVKQYFHKIPELMVYGNDEARSKWFAPEEIAWTEVIVPRAKIPISGTQMRQFMMDDDIDSWYKWTHPRLHKFYPTMRQQLLEVEYYSARAK